jgi:predicted transcriptional regulator of viral defense system
VLRRIPPELARKQIFTFDEAEQVFDVERESLRVTLSRMEEEGSIKRLERGKYLVVPLSARSGVYTLNEFVVGSELVEPYAVGYWSALSYHGLTEQFPGTVFIQTTSRKKKRDLTIFGVRYLIVKVSDHRFFGLEDTWIGDKSVVVTSREKTIVDCLDRPEYCGGVIEVAKALSSGSFDYDVLARYALDMNNSGVVRRIGFLCDYLGISIELPEIKTRNYLLLDPTMPGEGDVDGKWRLKMNLDLGDIE